MILILYHTAQDGAHEHLNTAGPPSLSTPLLSSSTLLDCSRLPHLAAWSPFSSVLSGSVGVWACAVLSRCHRATSVSLIYVSLRLTLSGARRAELPGFHGEGGSSLLCLFSQFFTLLLPERPPTHLLLCLSGCRTSCWPRPSRQRARRSPARSSGARHALADLVHLVHPLAMSPSPRLPHVQKRHSLLFLALPRLDRHGPRRTRHCVGAPAPTARMSRP